MNFNTQINRVKTADVIVVGGGTAGVFAAISAAKTGAKTLLAEKNCMLGGTVTAAGVNFPGLFFAWGKQIIDGPCWEAVKRTVELGGAVIPEIQYKPVRHWHEQIRVNRFVYTYVLSRMCAEAGVEVLTNSMVSHARNTADGIEMIITDKCGMTAVDAKMAIDATGDACVARIMGYPTEKSPVQQPATLQNHLSGYNPNDVSIDDIREKIEEMKKDDADFPDIVTAEKLMYFVNDRRIDTHTPCTDADTSEGRTKVEYDALGDTMRIYRILRSVKGLENICIDFCAEETGVRETCRIIGEKTVTAEEYVMGKLYDDAICYSFYPIDLHVMQGVEQTHLADGVVAKIPLGALIPKGSSRLLCAGRCLSSDVYANSALRVQASCMAMGQAAGCCAALCVADGSTLENTDAEKVRQSLEAIGAIVPR